MTHVETVVCLQRKQSVKPDKPGLHAFWGYFSSYTKTCNSKMVTSNLSLINKYYMYFVYYLLFYVGIKNTPAKVSLYIMTPFYFMDKHMSV